MDLRLSVKFKGREYRSPKRGIEAYRAYVEDGFNQTVKQIKPDMIEHLTNVVNVLIERHSGAWPGGTTPNSLSRRTGRSIAALRKGIKVTGNRLDTIRATLDIPLPLAYHEYGYSKRSNGKLLTIPLPAALTPNGVPLKTNPRQWPNTFVATSKAGNLIIFQRRGRRIIPLYLLKDTIKVPARLGARQEMQNAIPHFAERMADEIGRAFK
ncbi:putative tail protein [Rhizobium phage RHph_TM16]|nr:putative tail protein [Rhizobium phage RHph_TM16]